MKKTSLLIFILLFNISSVLAAQPLEAKIKKAVEEYKSSRFLNATYIFVQGDKIILSGANGVRSIKTKEPLNYNDQMPVASITKTMTAASILKLQDKKQLNVNDVISKYLDEKSNIWNQGKVPNWANQVTIHDLLLHNSGLTEYFMNLKIDLSKSHTEINKDIANFAASHELKFTPGSKFEYNNTNFVLLGLVVEKVSGKKLADFFNDELFTPIGMKNTRLASLSEAVESQINPDNSPFPTRYFVTPNGTKEPVMNEAKSEFIMVPFADGGVISTTEDLIKWHKALHNGKILSKESYKLMVKKHCQLPDKGQTKNNLGYGMFISSFLKECDCYHHAGNALAIRGESGYIPTHNFYYAILSNTMNYVPKEMADKVDMTKSENNLDISFFLKHILEAIDK